jgi:DNA-binding MarR family transcriptional regulator
VKSSKTRRKSNATSAADIETSVNSFRRILRELRLAARKTELTTGLSAAQLFVLSTVASSDECSINDIAAATMTDRSSAAAIVARLAEAGYVTRMESGTDRRRAAIAITPLGRRAMTRSSPAPTMLLIAGLRTLPAPQLRGLSRGLLTLTRAMNIAGDPPGLLFEEPRARAAATRGKRRSSK